MPASPRRRSDTSLSPHRSFLVLCRLDQEELLQVFEPRRHLRGEIVRLRPILLEVVELPLVLVGGPFSEAGRRAGIQGVRGPNADAIQPSL